ncbi:MAG TPA: TRCF domain-containing protein, partial [Verrucomicrobiae bacterium]|nr:TRCF domain-containing protein [Verrucomicrobiae bacterium]
PDPDISVPREVPATVQTQALSAQSADADSKPSTRAGAFIPLAYVSESRQRIDIYRKLAQAGDKAALDRLEAELRDRFGPLPPALELLLLVAELKILAAEHSVTVIEVKEDKLMLTRNNDYLTVGGKFPRLTKKDARARLKEIKRLLLAL